MNAISSVLQRWAEPRVGAWARVLRTAEEEARAAAHTRIGSEHLLLALVRAGQGQAAQHLRQLPVDVDRLRKLIVRAVDARGGDPQELGPVMTATGRSDREQLVRELLLTFHVTGAAVVVADLVGGDEGEALLEAHVSMVTRLLTGP